MFYNDRKSSADLGRLGEDMVAEYLRRQGYIIVKRNWKDKYGEIDVIAEDTEHIIFVEVKTRTQGALVSGAEAVNFYKAERIKKTALMFLSRLPIKPIPRFDVAEVTVFNKADGSVGYKLNYIKSAF